MSSPLRDKIMEKFKNDFTVMKMFFDELMKKVQGYIGEYQGPPRQSEQDKENLQSESVPKVTVQLNIFRKHR